MLFTKRDERGRIVGLMSNAPQESVSIDNRRLLEFLGVKYPESGCMYVVRDQGGEIVGASENTDAEQLDADHPEVVEFLTVRERIFVIQRLKGQAGSALAEVLSPLEQSRIALLADNDPEKNDAREVIAGIQSKLDGKTAEVKAASTPDAVNAVRW